MTDENTKLKEEIEKLGRELFYVTTKYHKVLIELQEFKNASFIERIIQVFKR